MRATIRVIACYAILSIGATLAFTAMLAVMAPALSIFIKG